MDVPRVDATAGLVARILRYARCRIDLALRDKFFKLYAYY